MSALEVLESTELTLADQAKIDKAQAIRALKRAARELRRTEGAPPVEGGPTGKATVLTFDAAEVQLAVLVDAALGSKP